MQAPGGPALACSAHKTRRQTPVETAVNDERGTKDQGTMVAWYCEEPIRPVKHCISIVPGESGKGTTPEHG